MFKDNGCEDDHDDTSCRRDQTMAVDYNHSEDKVLCRLVPARYLLVLLGFLGIFVSFSLRASLSVAVIAMVSATTTADDPHGVMGGSTIDTYPLSPPPPPSRREGSHNNISSGILDQAGDEEGLTEAHGGELNWDQRTQGLVLGAYYYGYVIPQMFGGWLARRLGARNVLGSGMLLSSLLTFLLPLSARADAGYFIAIRVAQRVAESVLFPAMNTMWSVWAPVQERGRLVNFTYACVLGCVWVLLWMTLVYDSPANHPRLSAKERVIFEKVYVAKKNGLLCSLPFLAQWLSLMGGSFLLDILRSARCLGTRRSRLLLNGIGGVLGASFFVAMGHVPERSHVTAVVVMTSAMGCAALCLCCLRQTVSQWRIFFYLTAALYLVGPLVFCVFSTKGRNLDRQKDRKSEEEKTGSLVTEEKAEVS
ncbi:hypothetical protein ACOMHN_042322 [Nucella lapillus]